MILFFCDLCVANSLPKPFANYIEGDRTGYRYSPVVHGLDFRRSVKGTADIVQNPGRVREGNGTS